MISEKVSAIISKLNNVTESGKVQWEKTSSDTEYYANFGLTRITIDLWYVDEAHEHRVDLSIYNDNGLRVEYIQYSETDAKNYNVLANLYNTVNRKYMKADETLDDILKELEDMDIPF